MEKRKILVIDDEESFARLVRMNLEETGKYKVRVATNGENGISMVKDFRPDLILLDILMPDMNGDEVAARLAQDENTKRIPIVFLTAIATKEETGQRDHLIGGHPFISKPINIEELVGCIEKNIR